MPLPQRPAKRIGLAEQTKYKSISDFDEFLDATQRLPIGVEKILKESITIYPSVFFVTSILMVVWGGFCFLNGFYSLIVASQSAISSKDWTDENQKGEPAFSLYRDLLPDTEKLNP